MHNEHKPKSLIIAMIADEREYLESHEGAWEVDNLIDRLGWLDYHKVIVKEIAFTNAKSPYFNEQTASNEIMGNLLELNELINNHKDEFDFDFVFMNLKSSNTALFEKILCFFQNVCIREQQSLEGDISEEFTIRNEEKRGQYE